MTARRLTIQDVADRVGLSKSSVSRALSGKPGVGEATRERVVRAARSMGYRVLPEGHAAARQILFVRQEIDPVSSELWLTIMHGAEREAQRLGFAILPRPADFAALLARIRVPVVCASYASPLQRVDHVLGADWEAGFAVARMLLGLGHREMAFVHGSAKPLGRAERFRGFRDGVFAQDDARAEPGARVDDLVFGEEAGFRGRLPRLSAGREGAHGALLCP